MFTKDGNMSVSLANLCVNINEYKNNIHNNILLALQFSSCSRKTKSLFKQWIAGGSEILISFCNCHLLM